jgi:anaerobic selenocysteine-containing dehydrogenase
MKNKIGDQIIKSTCGLCGIGCGILVYIRNGIVTKVEGDIDNPLNKGALCARGLASLEYLYHPDRLKHPLKRTGDRGSGKWRQISWDDALDEVAAQLTQARDNYGPEAVAFIVGMAKGLQDSYVSRLANVFGTPNVVWQGHVCFVSRVYASRMTYGFYAIPDFDSKPSCIVVWGKNMAYTLHHAHKRVMRAIENGAKLIVIDPIKTDLAEIADLWLQPRPGTDLALALSIINVIIADGLYDRTFVDKWTIGFDLLQEHVRGYPPEKIETITWVSAENIRKAARLYSQSRPACIQWGNPFDNGTNSFQAARAICILRAITGNIGLPGGEIKPQLVPLLGRRSPELELQDEMPPDKLKNRIGADLKGLPTIRYVQPQSFVKAILEKDPYPVHIAYVQGSNPLLSYPNTRKTYEAFMKLDFIAVSELFMTPTAAIADIVLPSATYLEWDSIVTPMFSYPVASIQQQTTRIGDCRSDYEILYELAKRLGLEKYFWDSEEQCLDSVLKPIGISFEEFRKIGFIEGGREYRSFEFKGFETPSGKVEIYSEQLKQWGLDPLPTYYEPPETSQSDPGLAKEYPLTLHSRKSLYRQSEGRQMIMLRGLSPEPIVNIHPVTADQLGIEEGDWVYIETKRGKIGQKAHLTTDVDPMVVDVAYAWWFPEKGPSDLYGWKEANINILTNDEPPYCQELGSTNFRGILCKVYKD